MNNENLLSMTGKLITYSMNKFEDGSIGLANEDGFRHIPAGVDISEMDKYKLDNPPKDWIDSYDHRQEVNKSIVEEIKKEDGFNI